MSARSRIVAALFAVVLALAAAAPAQAARRCATGKGVGHLAFKRTPGSHRGTLSWLVPAGREGDGLAYRVYRDGAVVGQTRTHAMRISVRIGRRVRFAVRVVGSGGALASCSTILSNSMRYLSPGRPAALAVAEVGDGVATLRWRKGRRGDGRPAGYRVYREGRSVGQFHATAAKIKVPADKRYAFTVRAVDTAGHQSPPAGPVQVLTSHTAPTAPSEVVVSSVGDRSVTLSWTPSLVGSGRITGYRVFRDGAMTGQVTATTATVGSLASARRYSISVAAVDSMGYLSPRSNAVTVSTDHRAPAAPTGLAAPMVSDTAVSLSWSPGAAGSSPVTGYRIARDGALVRQVPTSPAVVTNLAAAKDYGFQVTAVDSWGYTSPPSAAVSVRTENPVPTEGRIHAFLLASTDRSFEDLQAHYRQIGTLYPTYFDCAENLDITGRDDPLVTGWAQIRGIAVLPRFNCQSSSRLHTILTSPPARDAMINGILSLVQTHGYDGANIDYEAGLATDRAALTAFISELAARLHAIGKRITVEVSAKTSETFTGRAGFYDYAGLGAVSDNVFVMDWGLHWTTSAPGALEELGWSTRVADYAASMPNHTRFIMGTPMYALDWPNGGGPSNRANGLEWVGAEALARSLGITPLYDTTVEAPHYTYTDGAGARHDVWYVNARSISKRFGVAHDRGLGMGLWRLGDEDPAIWDDPLIAPGSVWP